MFAHRDDVTQSAHSGTHQRGSSGAHFQKQPAEPQKRCAYIYELHLYVVK